MAMFLADNGADFILLELMYRPDRMKLIFESAKKTNLPVGLDFHQEKVLKANLFIHLQMIMILISEK